MILKKTLKICSCNASDASNGINIDQLNPLAISFVEDYIDKFGEKHGRYEGMGKALF